MTVRSMLVAGRGGGLTLSGGTVTSTPVGSNATAQLFINEDGTVDRRIDLGARVQISAASDWIIPNGAAPDDYECRYTNLTGDALSAASASEDTWRALSLGDFSLTQFDDSPTAGGQSSTFDIEIRKGSSGGALVSASYTLITDRDDT